MSRCARCGAPDEACGCDPVEAAFELLLDCCDTEIEGEALELLRKTIADLEERALSAEHALASS